MRSSIVGLVAVFFFAGCDQLSELDPGAEQNSAREAAGSGSSEVINLNSNDCKPDSQGNEVPVTVPLMNQGLLDGISYNGRVNFKYWGISGACDHVYTPFFKFDLKQDEGVNLSIDLLSFHFDHLNLVLQKLDSPGAGRILPDAISPAFYSSSSVLAFMPERMATFGGMSVSDQKHMFRRLPKGRYLVTIQPVVNMDNWADKDAPFAIRIESKSTLNTESSVTP